jgi:uncharacterized protein YjbI with pentapeptide repeats
MANEEHLQILREGVEVWNKWREENPRIYPDLSEANLEKAKLRGASLRLVDLREAILVGADLREADLCIANLIGADLREARLAEADLRLARLSGTNLGKADLSKAKLSEANLTEANLIEADLRMATLIVADLSKANLSMANLSGAWLVGADLSAANLGSANLTVANLSATDLSEADLRGAYLTMAQLVRTSIREANLTGCSVFGISAWDLDLTGTIQKNLIITPNDEPAITVDNLEVAQFIYLLLNNEKIRDVINTITTKVVLILGRFTLERKAVLDAIRDELRKRDYLPVLFDFDKPASRDFTETVRTLAHLARFIIADITEPRSIPQELQAIVPDLAVPVQPLLLEGSTGEYGMFQDLRKYDWVLEVYRYDSLEGLLASLGDKVITPAEAKAKEIQKRRLFGG